jgi:hypothetical protein
VSAAWIVILHFFNNIIKIVLIYLLWWNGTEYTITRASCWLIVIPCMIKDDDCGANNELNE